MWRYIIAISLLFGCKNKSAKTNGIVEKGAFTYTLHLFKQHDVLTILKAYGPAENSDSIIPLCKKESAQIVLADTLLAQRLEYKAKP